MMRTIGKNPKSKGSLRSCRDCYKDCSNCPFKEFKTRLEKDRGFV